MLWAAAALIALQGAPAQAAAGPLAGRKVVFLIAENEYRAWQTLPAFGERLERQEGVRCEYLVSSTDDKDTNRFFIPRMEKVGGADLVVVFARRRALPAAQMAILRAYLDSGLPLIGIRTASHAFDANMAVARKGGGPTAANLTLPAGLDEWKTFDRDVLGCSYHGHYEPGVETVVTTPPSSRGHPLLRGVPASFRSPSWLYEVQPLAPGAQAVLLGEIPGKPPEPVLITNTGKQGGRIVYTTLGHWEDFDQPAFRRVLVNSVFWALGLEVPES